MKRDDIAAFVADVLDEMRDAGVPVPSRVTFLKLKDKATTVYYDDATDELVVNESGAFWKGSDQSSKQEAQFEAGRLSTPDPRHPILHEVGHAAHKTRDPRFYRTLKLFMKFLDEARLDLGDGQVSLYAMTSPHEFVAEVFAGLVVGMEYSESVMNWYENWRGWTLSTGRKAEIEAEWDEISRFVDERGAGGLVAEKRFIVAKEIPQGISLDDWLENKFPSLVDEYAGILDITFEEARSILARRKIR